MQGLFDAEASPHIAYRFVRSRIGHGQDHGPTFGNRILVEFRADLVDTLGAGGFFHAFVLHPQFAGACWGWSGRAPVARTGVAQARRSCRRRSTACSGVPR